MSNLFNEKEHRVVFDKILSGGKMAIIAYGGDVLTLQQLDIDGLPESICAVVQESVGETSDDFFSKLKKIPLKSLGDSGDTIVVIFSKDFTGASQQLEAIGCNYYWSFLLRENASERAQACIKKEQSIIQKHKSDISRVFSFLADDRSKFVFEKILKARTIVNTWERFRLISKIFSPSMYFPKDIHDFTLSQNEIFVDAGAYDGDTIKSFQSEVHQKFRRIYAFEPDIVNHARIEDLFNADTRVNLFNLGLYSQNTCLSFTNTGTGASRFASASSPIVNATSIHTYDVKTPVSSLDLLIKEPVSYIKMDIEGLELDALAGAEKTISKNFPKLAISVYHSVSDLWNIPLYIKQKYPRYRVFMRHHTMLLFDTVMYALPQA